MRIAPNWFTAAMGTGIVANAAALLPADAPALAALALGAWLAAAALLVGLGAAWAGQWAAERARAAAEAGDGGEAAAAATAAAHAMLPFWGAPPMAAMTVGAGALLAGPPLLGDGLALAVAVALWLGGTAAGVAIALHVPRRLVRGAGRRLDAVFATWLLPIVPPMVSAASGAALVAHAPAGWPRAALLALCGALFAGSGLAVVAIVAVLLARLRRHGAGPARMVPTLFIVLGPLGQSITAACLLAAVAPEAVGRPLADDVAALALIYAIPVWLAAMAWLAVAARTTIRAARAGMPFAPTWWSFTFPLGTCVTGTSLLAERTGAAPLGWVAAALFALLLAAWALVAAGSARHLARARRRALPLAA